VSRRFEGGRGHEEHPLKRIALCAGVVMRRATGYDVLPRHRPLKSPLGELGNSLGIEVPVPTK